MSQTHPVIDVHHHVGALGEMLTAPGAGDVRSPESERAQDIEARLQFMDENSIDQAVLLPANGGSSPNGLADRKADNDYVAAYRDAEPARFVAAAGTVSPLDGPGALDEIDRCVEVLGMRAICWHHHFLGTMINHAAMGPFLDRLAHHGIPGFVHILAGSTLESPWRLEILADQYPDNVLVALDGFSSTDQAQWMPYLAGKHPNVYFDTGVAVCAAHQLEAFIAANGSHRLLFGSDFYSSPRLFRVPFALQELRAADLAPEAAADVFGRNAARLLGLSA